PVLSQSPSPPAVAVPDVVVRARCVSCHAVDLIQQQRLGRAGWERELDKMIRWGAVVSDADRALLLEYLGTIARPPSAGAVSAAGRRALFAQRCLGCHACGIVAQDRRGSGAVPGGG